MLAGQTLPLEPLLQPSTIEFCCSKKEMVGHCQQEGYHEKIDIEGKEV
jgi:hypothetical protein